jgi:hypothetical protein
MIPSSIAAQVRNGSKVDVPNLVEQFQKRILGIQILTIANALRRANQVGQHRHFASITHGGGACSIRQLGSDVSFELVAARKTYRQHYNQPKQMKGKYQHEHHR